MRHIFLFVTLFVFFSPKVDLHAKNLPPLVLQDNCILNDLNVEVGICNEMISILSVTASHEGTTSDLFDFYVNGDFYLSMPYANLPVIYPVMNPNPGSSFLFEIVDQSNPSCGLSIDYNLESCFEGVCTLSELYVETEFCTDSIVFLTAGFFAEFANDFGYNILLNNEIIGFEEYSVTNNEQIFAFAIENPQFDEIYELLIIDEGDVECNVVLDFVLEPCEPCFIGDPILTVLDCENGQFYVDVDLDTVSASVDSFRLNGDGNLYGMYAVHDLPVKLGPFSGNGDYVYELIATSIFDQECASEYTVFGPVSCPVLADECLSFEGFNEGSLGILSDQNPEIYLGSLNDVNVYAVPFYLGEDGPVVYGYTGITNTTTNPVPPLSGNALEFESAGVFLDFSAFLNQSVQSVSFDYADYSSGVNLGINEDAFYYTESFFNVNGITGDYSITVDTILSTTNVEVGTVTITGEISELLIGLNYGFIDNICFTYLEEQDCELYNLSYTLLDCDDHDELSFVFDFDFYGVHEEGFLLTGLNFQYQEQFNYHELPLTITDFEEGLESYSFAIMSLGSPDTCLLDLQFETPDCYLDYSCSIEALNYEIVDCNPLDSTFYVNVWFAYDNLDSLTVSIFGSGYDWGEFDAWEQPVTLGPFYGNEGVYEVIIQDTYDPECFDVLEVDSPSCLYTDCEIEWLDYTIADCNPQDSSFYVNVWFDNSSLDSSMVSIFGSGYDWGEFNSWEQPIQLGPYYGDLGAYEVIIQNVDDLACLSEFGIDSPSCLYTDCSLSALEVDLEYCTDSLVYFDASFLAENVNPSFVYNLYLNEEFYGYYQYSATNNEQTFEFAIEDPQFGSLYTLEIVDEDDVSCSTAIEFVLEPCSNDCSINALEYEIVDCNPLDSTFYVNIWFAHDNLDSLTVSIFGSGYDWGEFDAWEQPVTLGPYYGDQGAYEVIIQDIDDLECLDVLEVDSPSCLYTDCEIEWFDYTISDCNPVDSTFYVNIWFDNSDLDSSMVSIYGSGYDWGEFNSWEQPIQLGPYYGDLGAYEVIIQNVDDLACLNEFAIDSPSCLYTDCEIEWFQYEVVDCNPIDSTFYVDIWFDNSDLDSSMVSIFGSGYDWGEFNSWEQPIQLGPYYGDLGAYEVIIQNVDDLACLNEFAIDSPSCLYTNAAIEWVEYTVVDCNPFDSTYYLEIWMGYENISDIGVQITTNGDNWGYFDPSNQPIVVGPITNNGEDTFIEIVDSDDPTCSALVSYETNCVNCDLIEFVEIITDPLCDTVSCQVGLNVSLSDAGAGETLDIHFSSVSYFDLSADFVNSTSLDLPYTAPGIDSLTVCISGTDCCYSMALDIPDPSTDLVWPGDANNDNIANNLDVLYIGLANSLSGEERTNMEIDWDGYMAEDWASSFPESGVNVKHADSNGSGIVNEEDIQAINDNYSLIHGPVEIDYNEGTLGDPALYVDMPELLSPGQNLELEVLLGDIDTPLEELYGIAFTIVYPEGAFVNNEVAFNFDQDWFGSEENVYEFIKYEETELRIDVTMVRNDQSNSAGYGRIGHFIGVIDDILGLQQVKVEIEKVRAIRSDESEVLIDLPCYVGVVSSTTDIIDDNSIRIFPNPAHDILKLEMDRPDRFIKFDVLDVNGALIETSTELAKKLDIGHFMPGVYTLRIQMENGIYIKRFTKV